MLIGITVNILWKRCVLRKWELWDIVYSTGGKNNCGRKLPCVSRPSKEPLLHQYFIQRRLKTTCTHTHTNLLTYKLSHPQPLDTMKIALAYLHATHMHSAMSPRRSVAMILATISEGGRISFSEQNGSFLHAARRHISLSSIPHTALPLCVWTVEFTS